MLLGMCEFCNNRRIEGSTVLTVLAYLELWVCAVKRCDILTVKCAHCTYSLNVITAMCVCVCVRARARVCVRVQ